MTPAAQAPLDEPPGPPEPIAPANLPTPEEASQHPLVKAVIEVFDGTLKQVYPRK